MKRTLSYLGAALAVLLTMLNTLPAYAAVTPAPASSGAASSSGLSITPRKNYIINPGQTITDKLTIGNLDNAADLTVSLKMIDFTFTNQSGTPKLFLAADAPQTPWSLKPFTTLPQNVTIPPGQSKTVSYTIAIPANQGAGSYYSAIMYQAGGGNGGNVALDASGVTLAFVSVPGTVNENLSLQKFGAYASTDSGVTGKYVFIATAAPQMIAYALKNSGNVAESPAGSIIVKDMFGRQIKTINATNQTSALALIGQTRLFTTCIKTVQQKIEFEGGTSTNTSCTDPGLIPGRYTANLDVLYGQNGNQTHEITAVATFWYLPWWFIIVVIAVVVLLALFVWWLVRKIKHSTRGSSKRRR